jgi:hypothetical protein
MPTLSEMKERVDTDFPDGFLARLEKGNPSSGIVHVIELVEVEDTLVLNTMEDMSGKVFSFTVSSYEIVQDSPKLARVLTPEYSVPWIFSDNLSDELRLQMRARRRKGVDLLPEMDPPNKTYSSDVTDEDMRIDDVSAEEKEAYDVIQEFLKIDLDEGDDV